MVCDHVYKEHRESGDGMKAKDAIRKLEAEGWREVRRKGSHRQFQHPERTGTVTIPDHGNKDLKIGTIRSIERQSGGRLR